MPINTHTGALEGQHLVPAVEHAVTDQFDGVQLYIKNEITDPVIFDALLAEIIASPLTNIVFHLENFDKLTPEQLDAVSRLIALIPENIKTFALIHMEYWQDSKPIEIKYSQVPRIHDKAVCIENSKTGVFDKDHIVRAFSLARSLKTGFVFDIGRILYPNAAGEVDELGTYQFIESIIAIMDPTKDIIHCAGKLDWRKKFRDAPSAFGAEGDITAPLKAALLAYHLKGGIIVFEHEDKQMILDSRDNLVKES